MEQVLSVLFVFEGDEFRRVAVETVFPFTQQCFSGQVNKSLGRASNIPDTNMAKYDDFDDYLEMVVQFGVSCLISVKMLSASLSLSFSTLCYLHQLSPLEQP